MSDGGSSMGVRNQPSTKSAWTGRLRAMTGRIDSFFLPLETVFLTTGARLRELYGTVTQLSGNIDTSGALFSADDMTEMLSGLTEAARHIDVMRQQRGGLAATLQDMIADTDAIDHSLGTLHRIMNQVQVLAINAKIEASQLVSTGIDFSVFTRDIARLAKSGEQTIAEVRQEMNGLRAAAAQAQALQHQFETRELPELDALSEQLSASINGLRHSQERAGRGAREIPERLRTLFGAITRLVSDLQVYDTTRQRLEHVEHALALTADMIDADDASGMDAQQQRVFVNGIADLQSLQLVHASDHYHKAVSDVGHNVAAMARGVPEVAELCRQAFGSGETGSLQEIDSNLEKASQVFTKFIATREQAAASLDRVVQATVRASDLMRSLNSVNGDMRLMGLNAAIKCGNMGPVGRALSVIAQELQAFANLTGERVQAVAGCLGKISRSAADIVGADKNRAGEIDVEALKRDIDQVVANLHLTGNGLTQTLDAIAVNCESVVAQTRAIDEGFSGKAECRQAMADGVHELNALAADSDPGLSGAALEEARRDVLAFTESHYTMASERSIHGAALDGHQAISLLTGADVSAGDPSAAHGEEQEPDIDDLLF